LTQTLNLTWNRTQSNEKKSSCRYVGCRWMNAGFQTHQQHSKPGDNQVILPSSLLPITNQKHLAVPGCTSIPNDNRNNMLDRLDKQNDNEASLQIGKPARDSQSIDRPDSHRDRNPSSLNEESEAPIETAKPNRYSSTFTRHQNRIHAFKVGVGVLLALPFVLIDPVATFFHHTGAWSLFTVVIVILPTPGETAKKMLNRIVGTVTGALFAVLLGLAGYHLSNIAYPVGHIMIAVVDLAAAIFGIHMADQGGTWSYAYLLGTITFVFLSASIVVENDVWEGVFRAVMIIIGGIIGLFVSWLPPKVSAYTLAKAYLADELLDTSQAAQICVKNFLKGQTLTPIHLIHGSGEENDDPFHQLSTAIHMSKASLEAALQASSFEGKHQTDVKAMRLSGIAVRVMLRSLMAADSFLRQDYDPLNPLIKEEAKLGLALEQVVSSFHATMLSHEMIDYKQLTKPGTDWESVPFEVPLNQALSDLESSLGEYITTKQLNARNSGLTTRRFTCHVGFARCIHDAGSYFLQVLPQLIAIDIGSTANGTFSGGSSS
jgi:Aluminium activated malate transporter